VISTSPQKEKEAREHLGADNFLISKDQKQMLEAARSLDYIIDTVSADHPLHPIINLLKVNGKLVVVGMPEKPISFHPAAVIFGKSSLHTFLLLLHAMRCHSVEIDSYFGGCFMGLIFRRG
jgi:cinnamyl-alcohol dehydrogenase